MNTERTETARAYDKAAWGPGPWQDEPDRVEFEHVGLPCLLLRSRLGNWCGYAAVPPGHPHHGLDYSKVDLDVHGGLTYADACSGHICHVPKPGEPDNVWWFGFDCGHFNDISPQMAASDRRRFEQTGDPLWRNFEHGAVYRDLAYVRAETERLAEQLAALGQ